MLKQIKLEGVKPFNGVDPIDTEKFGILGYAYDTFNVSVPNECPICHYGMDMSKPQQSFYDDADLGGNFNIISAYMCPHCRKGFVLSHYMVRRPINSELLSFMWMSCSFFPNNFKNVNINEQIREISPRFCEIYKQCLVAKNNGCSELYGMGFRKALEQLVTDYIISEYPNDKDKILRMTLHSRIETYFKEKLDTKTISMACKWLGNEETHYSNHDSDTDSLLLFENLIIDFIDCIKRDLRYKEAKAINDNHKKKN